MRPTLKYKEQPTNIMIDNDSQTENIMIDNNSQTKNINKGTIIKTLVNKNSVKNLENEYNKNRLQNAFSIMKENTFLTDEPLQNTSDEYKTNDLLNTVQATVVTCNIDDIPTAEGTIVTHKDAASLVSKGHYDKLVEARNKYIELKATLITNNIRAL